MHALSSVHFLHHVLCLCLLHLNVVLQHSSEILKNRLSWLDDHCGPSPILYLYDTAPLFIYTDQPLRHCIFICSNAHYYGWLAQSNGFCLLAESYETISHCLSILLGRCIILTFFICRYVFHLLALLSHTIFFLSDVFILNPIALAQPYTSYVVLTKIQWYYFEHLPFYCLVNFAHFLFHCLVNSPALSTLQLVQISLQCLTLIPSSWKPQWPFRFSDEKLWYYTLKLQY